MEKRISYDDQVRRANELAERERLENERIVKLQIERQERWAQERAEREARVAQQSTEVKRRLAELESITIGDHEVLATSDLQKLILEIGALTFNESQIRNGSVDLVDPDKISPNLFQLEPFDFDQSRSNLEGPTNNSKFDSLGCFLMCVILVAATPVLIYEKVTGRSKVPGSDTVSDEKMSEAIAVENAKKRLRVNNGVFLDNLELELDTVVTYLDPDSQTPAIIGKYGTQHWSKSLPFQPLRNQIDFLDNKRQIPTRSLEPIEVGNFLTVVGACGYTYQSEEGEYRSESATHTSDGGPYITDPGYDSGGYVITQHGGYYRKRGPILRIGFNNDLVSGKRDFVISKHPNTPGSFEMSRMSSFLNHRSGKGKMYRVDDKDLELIEIFRRSADDEDFPDIEEIYAALYEAFGLS